MDKINVNKLWVRDFHFAKDIYFTLTPQYKKWDIIGVKRKILSVNVYVSNRTISSTLFIYYECF